tara:strand:- start:1130 stop:1363 length:234 start_codon:yes stop_codon:yes gene_type:complete
METPTYDDLIQRLEKLRMENEELKKKERKVFLKKSEKGGVQIMGVRRFPITLYRKELDTIFNMKNEIVNFMDENEIN